ncbi:MAG: hypothetical protein R2791_17135 [Saprospiraceae bacterium]
MNKHNCYLIALLFFVIACKPNTKPAVAQNKPLVTGPPTGDLLEVLQGRWQNEQDTAYFIEFSGNRMKRIEHDSVSEGCNIKVYIDCPADLCKVDSLTASEGWCFVEMRENGDRCMQILNCDTEHLQFRPLDGDSLILSFKKI